MHIFITLFIITFSFMLAGCAPHVTDTLSSHLNANPTNEEASELFNQADYAGAAVLYELKLKNSPNDEHLKFKLAESLRLSEQTEKAISIYTTITINSASTLAAQEGMALAHLQQYELDKAKEIFLTLLEKDASRWRTLNALGVINSLQNNPQEAREYFTLAQTLAPQKAATQNNLGLSLALASPDTLPEGVTLLEKALQQAISTQEKKQISTNLALAYSMLNNDTKAQEVMAPYLSEAAIYNNLGVFASLRNDKKLAKSYLSKALSSQPVHYEKAWSNLEKL